MKTICRYFMGRSKKDDVAKIEYDEDTKVFTAVFNYICDKKSKDKNYKDFSSEAEARDFLDNYIPTQYKKFWIWEINKVA